MNGILNRCLYSLIHLIYGCKHFLTDLNRWSSISPYIVYNYLRYHGVDLEFGSVRMVGFPIIHKARNSRITLGSGITLVSHSIGNPAGVNHPVILATLRENATIAIGDGCGFSGSSICAAMSVIIGDHSGFGANASVYDTDFHSITYFGTNLDGISQAASKPVKVGRYVWVGANALILKGVHIEDHCIVPAGAVVRTSLSANSRHSKTDFERGK